jgi:hypothetical protein
LRGSNLKVSAGRPYEGFFCCAEADVTIVVAAAKSVSRATERLLVILMICFPVCEPRLHSRKHLNDHPCKHLDDRRNERRSSPRVTARSALFFLGQTQGIEELSLRLCKFGKCGVTTACASPLPPKADIRSALRCSRLAQLPVISTTLRASARRCEPRPMALFVKHSRDG